MGYVGSDRPRGSDTGTQVAVPVTTSATVLKAANDGRVCVTVSPTNGDIYVGYTSAVTTSTGILVASGASFEERDFTGALYGRAATTVDVRVLEVGG